MAFKVSRPVLLTLLWIAPAAFVLSFLCEYLDRPPSALFVVWIPVMLGSGVPPLLVPSLGIRIAGGLTMLPILYCVAGMLDMALYNASRDGFGLVIFLPPAVLVILGQVVLAVVVSLRRS